MTITKPLSETGEPYLSAAEQKVVFLMRNLKPYERIEIKKDEGRIWVDYKQQTREAFLN